MPAILGLMGLSGPAHRRPPYVASDSTILGAPYLAVAEDSTENLQENNKIEGNKRRKNNTRKKFKLKQKKQRKKR
jgi:hypothetical protein